MCAVHLYREWYKCTVDINTWQSITILYHVLITNIKVRCCTAVAGLQILGHSNVSSERDYEGEENKYRLAVKCTE